MLKSNISDGFFFINIQKSKLIQIMIYLWKKNMINAKYSNTN